MPRISDVYAGKYLSAPQLEGRGRIPAVITEATVESLGRDQTDQKVVLKLRSPDGRVWPQGLVLNVTNSRILSTIFGDDTDSWINQRIEVWSAWKQFQGKPVKGIELGPAGGADPVPAPVPAPSNDPVQGRSKLRGIKHSGKAGSSETTIDDEIPF